MSSRYLKGKEENTAWVRQLLGPGSQLSLPRILPPLCINFNLRARKRVDFSQVIPARRLLAVRSPLACRSLAYLT